MPSETSVRTNESSDLASLVDVLKRRAKLLVLCCLLGCIAAVIYSLLQPKEYSASATLLLTSDSTLAAALFGGAAPAPEDPARRTETALALAQQRIVAVRTAERLDGRLTSSQVAARVTTSAGEGSELLTVTATGADAGTAARVANVFAEQFVELRRAAATTRLSRARARIDSQLRAIEKGSDIDPSTVQRLRDRLVDLDSASTLVDGGVELSQRAAVPDTTTGLRASNAGLIGLFAGLLAGCILVLVREQFDKRLQSSNEAALVLDLPVLASIPRSVALERGDLTLPLTRQIVEAFRTLRTTLRHSPGSAMPRSLLITSSESGDGKTTVAFCYAQVEALAGVRVLLIEADLRRPTLARRLGISQEVGLCTFLGGSTLAPEKHVVEVVVTIPGQLDGSPRSVSILPAGGEALDPPSLLESDRMRWLLSWAFESFDLVVLDTPPFTAVSDAAALMAQVEGVIVVSRIGADTSASLSDLRDRLVRVEANTLGVVATFVDESDANPYARSYLGART